MITRKEKLYYPVTLEDAMEHLNETDPSKENYISRLIKVATQEAENIIGMDIAYTKNTLTIDDFCGSSITILEGNFIAISSIKANDTSIGYEKVIAHPHKFTLEFTDSLDVETLEIVFYTGYEENSSDSNLETIKQYIMIKTDDLYSVERSSYSFNALNNSNKAESLLSSLKGFY